jgi:hypothetical protein
LRKLVNVRVHRSCDTNQRVAQFLAKKRQPFIIFPVMLIEDKVIKYWIDNFYGYGSWNAKFWFVGYEESGGDIPEEVFDRLNYFYDQQLSNTRLCDLRELYRHVIFRVEGPRAEKFANLYDYRFGSHATLHGLWKNLIAFVHGYQNEELPDQVTYQKNSFALPSPPTEALIPLYPLPTHDHAWYYAWLDLPQFPFLKSRSLFQDYVYPARMQTILENMSVYRPEVVLMYGMDNINLLKKSVEEFFQTAKFKMGKAMARQIPQHHRTDLDGTILLITTQVPALKHNRVETGFDWYEFGKLVKATL